MPNFFYDNNHSVILCDMLNAEPMHQCGSLFIGLRTTMARFIQPFMQDARWDKIPTVTLLDYPRNDQLDVV